jgi:hypothetical protein
VRDGDSGPWIRAEKVWQQVPCGVWPFWPKMLKVSKTERLEPRIEIDEQNNKIKHL